MIEERYIASTQERYEELPSPEEVATKYGINMEKDEDQSKPLPSPEELAKQYGIDTKNIQKEDGGGGALPTPEELAKKYGVKQEGDIVTHKPGELQQAPKSGKPEIGLSPTGIAKGLAGFAEATMNVVPDTINAVYDLDNYLKEQGITSENFLEQKERWRRLSFAPQPEKEEMLGYMSAALLANMAASSLTTLKTGSTLAGVVAGGASNALFMDPAEKNLSGLIKEFGMGDTPVVGHIANLLETDPNDSMALNRVKNTFEGIGLGALSIGAMKTITGSIGVGKRLMDARKAGQVLAQDARKASEASQLKFGYSHTDAARNELESLMAKNIEDLPQDQRELVKEWKDIQDKYEQINKRANLIEENLPTNEEGISKISDKLHGQLSDFENEYIGLEARQVQIEKELVKVRSVPVKEFPDINVKITYPPGYVSPFEGMDARQVRDSIRNVSPEAPLFNVDPLQKAESGIEGVARAAQEGEKALKNKAVVFGNSGMDSAFKEGISLYKNREEFAKVLQKSGQGAFSPAETVAVSLEAVTVGDEFVQLADSIASGKVTDEESLARFTQLKHYWPYVYNLNESIFSKSGTSLSIKSFMYETTPRMKKSLVALSGGKESIIDEATALSEISAKIGKARAIEGLHNNLKIKPSFIDGLHELYVQNLLGPKTAMTVAASNITEHAISLLEKELVARQLLKADPKSPLSLAMKQASDESRKATLKAVVAETAATYDGFLKGLKALGEGIFEGRPLSALNEASKKAAGGFRYGNKWGVTGQDFALDSENITNRFVKAAFGPIVDTVGSLSRFNASAVAAMDRFSDALAVSHQGTFLGILEANNKGLTGDAARQYVEQILASRPVLPMRPTLREFNNNVDLFEKAMEKYDEGLKAYNDAGGKLWEKIDGFRARIKFSDAPATMPGKQIYEVTQNYSILRGLSPFTRNLINMAERTYDYTPFLAGMSERNRAIFAQGGIEAELLKKRLHIQYGLFGVGAILVASGLASPGESPDKYISAMQRAQGFDPYSMGGVNYSKFGGLGISLKMGADLFELTSYVGKGMMSPEHEVELEKLIKYAGGVLSDMVPLDEVTAEVVGAFKGNELTAAGIIRPAQKYAATLLNPGTVRFIRAQVDPVQRQAVYGPKLDVIGTAIRMIRDGTFGLSSSLPPALDVLGYEMKKRGNLIRLPTDPDPDILKKNQVLAGLVALNMMGPGSEGMAEEFKITPIGWALSLPFTDEKILLTGKQRNDLILMSLGKDSPSSPGEFEPRLWDILGNTSIPDMEKKSIIKREFSKSRTLAKRRLLDKYPDLDAEYQRLKDKYGVAREVPGTDFMED